MNDLIFPDPGKKILLVKASDKQGSTLYGTTMDLDNSQVQMIEKELDYPFHQSMIKLNQCSRNFSGDKEGPNVLYLSDEEGGFPRHGLSIEGIGEFPELNYVDLVLDEERVKAGALSIFTHELGHVMMMNIWDNFPESLSPKQHVSMGVTDYFTAFFEGWGEHFQFLAYHAVEKYRLTHKSRYQYDKVAGSLWHSVIDGDLRINAVLKNDYVHQKLLPGTDLRKLGIEELILTEHTSPIFDRTKLKNAQQMLSCEGVLATLFARINTNEVLQTNYAGTEFYRRFFLEPGKGGKRAEEIFTPSENVFLKSFWVWSRIKDKTTHESKPFVDFINCWCDSFPQDREEMLRIFLLTTVCKTVTNDLADIYEKMSYYGMVGDMKRLQKHAKLFKQCFTDIKEHVISGKSELDENIGPQLWVENPDFEIRTCLWEPENKAPLSINLNTASQFDLASFPGVSINQAKEIVDIRDNKGYFKSIREVQDLGFTL